MRRHSFTFGLAAGLFALALSQSGGAGEPCVSPPGYCPPACPPPTACQDECRPCKDVGFRIGIPGVWFGVRVGCDDCGHHDCCHEDKSALKDWWDKKAPPRAPVVFSIPAVTIPQQAVAITPVSHAMVPVSAHAQQCPPRQDDPAARLLMEALVRQLGTPQSQAQAGGAPPAPPATASSDDSGKSVESRMLELEQRMDRILQALERRQSAERAGGGSPRP